MKNLIIKLSKTENLNLLEKTIANFILENLNKIQDIDIRNLSSEVNCSISSISRFVKKLGYRNFVELKYDIKQYNNYINQQKINKQDILKDYSYKTIKYIDFISKNISSFINDPKFLIIKNLILNSKKIFIFASGGSYTLAYDLMIKLLRIRINAFATNDHIIQETLVSANANEKDTLFFFISITGQTNSLIKLAKKLKCKNATMCLLTANANSKLKRIIEHTLIGLHNEDELSNLIGNNRVTFLLLINLIFESIIKEKSNIFINLIIKSSK